MNFDRIMKSASKYNCVQEFLNPYDRRKKQTKKFSAHPSILRNIGKILKLYRDKT